MGSGDALRTSRGALRSDRSHYCIRVLAGAELAIAMATYVQVLRDRE
jgi:hypothetical protein